MTLEITQDVSRAPVSAEKNWAESALVSQELLTGKSSPAQAKESAAAQRELTDRGIIPDLQLDFSAGTHDSSKPERPPQPPTATYKSDPAKPEQY